jgi:hypothetical protein
MPESKCVCMYVCMYVFVCVSIYLCVYVYVSAILNDWSADKIEAGRQGRQETCQKLSACVYVFVCIMCVYVPY